MVFERGWKSAGAALDKAIRTRDLATIKKLWNELVPRFDDISFSGYLATSKAFSALRRPGAGPVPRGSGEAAQDSDTAPAPGLGHGERPRGQHRQDPVTRTDRRDRDR